MPSFAFINGVALGGGLEVALHCTYRTISSGVPMVAFPECFLGLVPGWGGAYLLPRLIGPARALKLIIENPLSQNKMLRGPEAFELGIADAMFEPADFLEESLRWASLVLTGAETVSRQGRPDAADLAARAAGTEEEWAQAVAAARLFIDGKVHGAAPAPVPGPGPGRGGAYRLQGRGVRRRGRRPGRPAALRGAARRPVRVRPRAEARQAPGRRAGQVPCPARHQGRRRRRGPDGGADRPAVRQAAAGSRRDDRPRPGAG